MSLVRRDKITCASFLAPATVRSRRAGEVAGWQSFVLCPSSKPHLPSLTSAQESPGLARAPNLPCNAEQQRRAPSVDTGWVPCTAGTQEWGQAQQ